MISTSAISFVSKFIHFMNGTLAIASSADMFRLDPRIKLDDNSYCVARTFNKQLEISITFECSQKVLVGNIAANRLRLPRWSNKQFTLKA